MDEIRIWIVGALSAIAAFISPISGDIYSMVFLFAFNFFFGLVADISNGGHWEKEKVWKAFKEAMVFFAFVFFIFGIGKLKGNMNGAQQCVSFVAYSLYYFYSTNICRNMVKITREGTTAHAAAKWLYWVLSVEFIKQIPYLKAYIAGKSPLEAADEPGNGILKD